MMPRKASAAPSSKQNSDGRVIESFMRETNGGGSLEQVAGFTLSRAITEGFGSARLPIPPTLVQSGPTSAAGSILPPQIAGPEFGVNLENVIGVDDRVMVPDTAMVPWRCICQLEVVFHDGTTGYGTGWLAGPSTVITAGHCLIDPRSGKAAAQIRVTPGRNSQVAPYGFFVSTDYAVMLGWPSEEHSELDVGAITIESELPVYGDGIGTRLGYFGIAEFTDEKLNMLMVNTAGYPVEARKPFGTLWFNGGRVHHADADFLQYMIDTQAGQSGSPVFFFEQERDLRLVVAIHTTGYYPNRGLRVNPRIYDAISAWVAKPPRGIQKATARRSAAGVRRR